MSSVDGKGLIKCKVEKIINNIQPFQLRLYRKSSMRAKGVSGKTSLGLVQTSNFSCAEAINVNDLRDRS